jgi:hypothetical protein
MLIYKLENKALGCDPGALFVHVSFFYPELTGRGAVVHISQFKAEIATKNVT